MRDKGSPVASPSPGVVVATSESETGNKVVTTRTKNVRVRAVSRKAADLAVAVAVVVVMVIGGVDGAVAAVVATMVETMAATRLEMPGRHAIRSCSGFSSRSRR